MKRKVLLISVAISCIAVVAIAFFVKSKSYNARASTSTVTWTIDNQMKPMDTPQNETWTPATDTPPTTPQNAIDVAAQSVGGPEHIHSPLRVRYVLVSQPWENGLKNHPMWVVQIDKISWTFVDTGNPKTADSRAEILIDANTGKELGGGIAQIPSKDPTPAP